MISFQIQSLIGLNSSSGAIPEDHAIANHGAHIDGILDQDPGADIVNDSGKQYESDVQADFFRSIA
jgi:hypothetical protein